MKIVADRNVPFLEGVFETYAEIVYMDGRINDRVDRTYFVKMYFIDRYAMRF